MKFNLCFALMVNCFVVLFAFGKPFQTGHFVMTLTDKESRPITNATIYVKTLNRTGLMAGVYDSHYTIFSAPTDHWENRYLPTTSLHAAEPEKDVAALAKDVRDEVGVPVDL